MIFLIQMQVREAQRKYADLETRMKEDLMMARIREAENTQFVAELTQKISSLEYKVRTNNLLNVVAKMPKLFNWWNLDYFGQINQPPSLLITNDQSRI